MGEIKKWWTKWEQIILTMISLIVVATGSYMFGVLNGLERANEPLKITQGNEKNTVLCNEQCQTAGSQGIARSPDSTVSTTAGSEKNTKEQKDACVFVGSVNGSKFYPPNCKAVGRIKKENLTCFSSEEDAQKKGYSRTSACK